MVPFVESDQVLEVNAQNFGWPNYPNGISKQIPSSVQIINAFWRIPKVLGNQLIGYDFQLATSAIKPTPDSVKMLRVKDPADNTEYGFAITDSDHLATSTPADEFAYLCNGAAGSLPVMPTVTIPTPIMQQSPASTDPNTSTNTFVFAFPDNPLGLLYSIPFPWFNGVAPATAYAPSGITTLAQLVTWANTSGHWDGFGTWSSPSANILELASPTNAAIYVEKAGMEVTLTAVPWCFDFTAYSTPAAINGLKIGTGDVIPLPAFMLTDSNQATVINYIKQYLPKATFSTSIAHKLQVNTTQDVLKLYNNGSPIVTATQVACS